MKKIRNMTIKNKLTVIMVITGAAAVLLSCVIFIVSSFFLIRSGHLKINNVLAEVTGRNCQTALMFNVPEDAEKVLSTLQADNTIVFACVYTKEGEPFAVYRAKGISDGIESPEMGKEGHEYSDGFLKIFQDIRFEGNVIGTLYLQDNQKDVFAAFKWDLVTLFFVILIAIASAFLIASKLQAVISDPILSLARTAGSVRETEDYSIRAEKYGGDEVGILIDSFNLMLSEIQQREADLATSESKFRALVETSSDWIWEVDSNGCYTYSSPNVEELLGYMPDEVIGTKPFDLMPPEEAGRVALQFAQVSEAKIPFNSFGNINIHKDGRRVVLETSAVPILDEAGNLVGYRGIDRDITERKRAEEKIENLAKFPDENPNPVLRISSEGVLLFANDASKPLLGEWNCDVGEEMPVYWSNKVRQVLLDESEEKVELEFAGKVLSFVIAPVPEADYANLYGRDITDRKKAEDALRFDESRLQVLVEINQMTDATMKELVDFALEQTIKLTKSKLGYIAFMNDDETVLEMYSWSKTAMAECMIREKSLIFPVADTGLWGEAVRQRKPIITNDYQGNEPLKKGYPKGHVHVLRHMNVPVFDGKKIVAVAGVGNKEDEYNDSDARQLTLLMEGMWRILQRNKVEKERDGLLKALASKNDELESVVYTASHDLRSPLVNIDGFSSELARSCEDVTKVLSDRPLTEKAEQQLLTIVNEDIPASLQFIRTSAGKMDMLMRGLLKLSRLGRAAIDIEPIDMNELLANIKHGMQHQVNKRQVELAIEDLPPCLGDRSQISQVFTNLLDNAIKYLDQNRKGKIHIEGKDAFDECIYSVADNGVGIEKSCQDKAFEIFHRLSPEGSVKGEGIGLTIVKRILDRHNGRIWMESKAGEGTVFHVALLKA